MLDEAYYELHTLELQHWWYVGARMVYRSLLNLGLGDPNGNLTMLEIGSGSGGNLALLSEYGATVGIDPSWLALKLTRHRPDLGLVQAQAEFLPFADNCFDGVNLLGVIEHLEDDLIALEEAVRVSQETGVVTLLTSALSILWSHHDEANRHKRRYLKSELAKLLQKAGLAPIRMSYINFFVFMPVLIIRRWQRFQSNIPRYDMGNPKPLLNAILKSLLRFESWIIRWLELPIGVDLVAVCRPRKRS